MAESNIKCKHIQEINCPSFDDNRLCPDNCKDFVSKENIIYEVEIKEETTEKRRIK